MLYSIFQFGYLGKLNGRGANTTLIMSDDGYDDYSYQRYREEMEDDRDYEEEMYDGYYESQEEEDMEVALKMYGRNSAAYRAASKAYRHRGGKTISPYTYRHGTGWGGRRYYNRSTVIRAPLPPPINQSSVTEGRFILLWILEDRLSVMPVLAQIIVLYVDDSRLAEMFDNLEKLRLT